MSPEPFDSRAEAPPAKRWEKGYGDENGAWPIFPSVTHFFQVWPIFPSVTHFSRCDPFIRVTHFSQVWTNFQSVTHLSQVLLKLLNSGISHVLPKREQNPWFIPQKRDDEYPRTCSAVSTVLLLPQY